MSKTEGIDNLTPEEIEDIEEFYRTNDHKTMSAEDFLKELRSA